MLKKIVASEFLVFITLISKDLLTGAHLRDYRLNDPSNGQQPNYWLIIGRSALERWSNWKLSRYQPPSCSCIVQIFSYLYLLSLPVLWQPHWCSNCLYVRVYLCCTALQASCGSIAKWGSVLLVRSKPEAKIRISGRFWSDLKPRYWKQGYQGHVCLQ